MFLKLDLNFKAFSTDYGSHEFATSDLLSINTPEEHGFIINHLNKINSRRYNWYIGAMQQGPDNWVNPDGTSFINIENALSPLSKRYGEDYMVYNFSSQLLHWQFLPVRGDQPFVFICEANVATLQKLIVDDRGYTYGIEIENPKEIPRGPYFVQQPKDVTFDTSRRQILNSISLRFVVFL